MDTKTLLRQIGGQAAISRECEISESAVSQWVDDDAIPSARLKYLRLAHPGAHWIEYDNYLKAKIPHTSDQERRDHERRDAERRERERRAAEGKAGNPDSI